MIKAVIFDMDGVLVDNRDIHIDAFVIFCKRYGCELSRTELLQHFGKGNDEIMPVVLPQHIIEEKGIEALADEKEEIYREIFEQTIKPTPGLVEFIKDLEANNIKRAVGSSGQSANVNFVLEKCGISTSFNGIANGDMVTKCKPDPEVFLLAAKLIDMKPEECVVIEDSFAGIEAAHSAGMKVIAMATTYSQEELKSRSTFDLIVDDFRGLTAETLSKL